MQYRLARWLNSQQNLNIQEQTSEISYIFGNSLNFKSVFSYILVLGSPAGNVTIWNPLKGSSRYCNPFLNSLLAIFLQLSNEDKDKSKHKQVWKPFSDGFVWLDSIDRSTGKRFTAIFSIYTTHGKVVNRIEPRRWSQANGLFS